MYALLSRNLLSKKVLQTYCVLDYGRHSFTATATLSYLDRLPVELQQLALLFVDLESLLRFRGVNKQAMDVVDKLAEWKKILKHAPDTICMAVGSHTASTFNLHQLFSKLCQKHCDHCSSLGPYINMFTLQRRCFDVEQDRRSSCSGSPDTDTYVRPERVTGRTHRLPYRYPSTEVEKLPTFEAIPGRYGL